MVKCLKRVIDTSSLDPQMRQSRTQEHKTNTYLFIQFHKLHQHMMIVAKNRYCPSYK